MDTGLRHQKKQSFLQKLNLDYIHLYPWPLLYKTSLLWFSFFCLGLSDSIRGPTLLDLKDLINEDVSAVSSTFALRAFGGLFGCFLSGSILDSLAPSSRYIFIALAYFVLSSCTLYLPYSPNLLVMQVVSTIFGVFNGCFHTATNPLLLRIWEGRNSSPYMYAMHFCFGLGGLLAPVLAKPFLKEDSVGEVLDENGNEVFRGEESYYEECDFWTIKTLYPIIGFCMVLAIPGYIYYFVQELKIEKKNTNAKTDNLSKDDEEDKNESSCKKYLLIVLMAVFYFNFAGLETSYRTFTSAFAVSCSLNLSRHQAADVLAVFYSTFATFRALIIPLSAFVSPTLFLWSSLTMICIATVSLSLWAETSLICLKVGVALAGAGVASLFASGMLWMKQTIPVTNKVGSVITMSCSVAAQVYCMVIGSYVEEQPMLFNHLLTGTMMGLVVTFAFANIVASSIRREQRKSILA